MEKREEEIISGRENGSRSAFGEVANAHCRVGVVKVLLDLTIDMQI